jgi:uncharacterized protein with HEPN domain
VIACTRHCGLASSHLRFACFDGLAVAHRAPDRHYRGDVPLTTFAADWQARWVVERGAEIISEASRRLPGEMKARHPEIPWSKVAGIGNVLRHDYQAVSAPIMSG